MNAEKSTDQPKQIEINPISSIEEAQKYLLNELHECALAYDQNRQREGMVRALEAAIAFLDGRGFPPAHLRVFKALIDELDYIYDGNRSLILQPGVESAADLPIQHKGPGNDPIKIHAAACSEAIYRLGQDEALPGFDKLTRNEAYARLARAMENWPTYNQTLKIKGRRIKGWRDKFAAKARSEPKESGYQLLTKQFLNDEKGHRYLKEVIKNGPDMTGGFRK